MRAIVAEPAWLLPLALVAYVPYVTWTWEFPDWRGVPFPPIWLVATIAGLVVWRRVLGRDLAPLPVAAIVVVCAMVMTDVTVVWTQGLRDLELYVKAGGRWLAGDQVYRTVPLTERPEDLSDYPFLYPPLTLPLFATLAVLPWPLAAAIWTSVSAAAVVAAFRSIGLGWRWTLLLLAWPPTAQGIYVGNVAVPMFALFAAAASRPALLVVPPIFKIHNGVAALFLLRPDRLRSLAVGAAAVAVALVATLPLTGLALWGEWVDGLRAYQVSQALLPRFLYGFGLARYVPVAVVLALGLVVTVVALRARRPTEQLGRLGVATVVASPSLHAHGWLMALPSSLGLEARWFWLVLGLTACSPGMAWFVALGVVIAAWYVPELRRGRGDDRWHPLGASLRPWPRVRSAIPRAARRAEETGEPAPAPS